VVQLKRHKGRSNAPDSRPEAAMKANEKNIVVMKKESAA
jgi:hypothetical protein